MNEIIIEKTKKAHYKSITEIYNYYVLNSTVTYHVAALNQKELTEYFGLNSVSTKSFIIKVDNAIIGFCLIRPYSKKEGYKYTFEITIYLKPGNENKGIGKKVLSFLEIIAKNMNVHILLAGICTENERSIKLFEKFGFKRCGYFEEVGYKFNRFLDTAYYQKKLDLGR